MPKLKAVLDTVDDLDEALRAFYEEKDGKFYLAAEQLTDHPDVVRIAGAIKRERDNTKQIKQKYDELKARLDKLGDDLTDEDLDQLRALRDKLAAGDDDDDDDDVDDETKKKNKNKNKGKDRRDYLQMLEQKTANLTKKYEDKLKEKDEIIARKDAYIRRTVIEAGVQKALVDAGIKPAYMEAAMAMILRNAELEADEDGDELSYAAVVKVKGGDTVPVEKYVPDWAASDAGKHFVEPAKGGDAGPGNTNSRRQRAGEANPWKDGASFNMTEQAKIFREDRARAERLAKEAGKPVLPGGAPVKASA